MFLASFGVLLDNNNVVQVVFHKEVGFEEWYRCSDSTNTGYVKIKTAQIISDFFPFEEHTSFIKEV